ncbi:MAG TPA: DUF1559 domain-containing protein [Gemmatales bacterium]|nr:DUF1559 domain-containing protein [Gemmatales bacterium]
MYRRTVSLLIALVVINSAASQDTRNDKPLFTRFIGSQTIMFMHYRVPELLNIPALQSVLAGIPGGQAQMSKDFQKNLGIAIEDIDFITMYLDEMQFVEGRPQEPRAPYVLLTSKKALDFAILRRSLGDDVKTIQHGKFELMLGKTQAIARIDDRSVLFFSETRGVAALEKSALLPFARAEAATEVPDAWKQVVTVASAGKHPFFLGFQIPSNLSTFAEEALKNGPPIAATFKALTKVQSGYLSLNYVASQAQDCQFKIAMHFPDAKAAQTGLGSVKFGIATGKVALNSLPKEEAPRNLENFWLYAAGFAKKQIDLIKPTQQESTVSIDYAMNSKEFLPVMTLMVEKVRYAADKMLSASNMRQLMIAMHNYHNDFNMLPPVMSMKDGKPLHSWRVHILPYIEEDKLYKQLKLDEPWDSEHNKKVFESNPMPKFFEHPHLRDGASKKTYYQVFYSKADNKNSAAFRPDKKLTLGQLAVQDGNSNTIAMAEHGKPVLWFQPEDIEFDSEKPFPPLKSTWGNKLVQVAFFDASIRTLILGADEEAVYKALVTWRGGENIDTSKILD